VVTGVVMAIIPVYNCMYRIF